MTLKERLDAIAGGRFESLFDTFKTDEICGACGYFNLSITDPRQRYRCACLGQCMGVTLSTRMLKFLNKELGYTNG